MQPTLFDDAEPPETPEPFALWHRASRRHKWRLIGTGPTGAKALELMDGAGDWMLIDAGYEPHTDTLASAQAKQNGAADSAADCLRGATHEGK